MGPPETNGKTAYYSTATTILLVTGSGYVGSFLNHTVGVGATAILYDNIVGSGNVIWSWVTADGKVNLPINLRFVTGLTLVTTGGTPPAGAVTYRGNA